MDFKKLQPITIFIIFSSITLSFEGAVVARTAFSPLASLKTSDKTTSCVSQECHSDKKFKMEQSLHRHTGFAQMEDDQSCVTCHVEEGIGQMGVASTSGGANRVHDPALREVHVVKLSNLSHSTKYRFRIRSADSAGKTVVMESDDFVLTTEPHSSSGKTLPAKAPQVVPQDLLDSAPPRIMDVSVDDMRWGPLISAKISWKTDRASTSKVEYGATPSLGLSSAVDFSPKTDHGVTLYGLCPAKIYYYQVHSATPSGTTAISTAQTFKTPSSRLGSLFQKKIPILEWLNPPAMAETVSLPLLITTVSIAKVTEKSGMVTWETNRPSDTLLEYQAVLPSQDQKSFVHPRMKAREKIGMATCYGCHPAQKLGASHPVNISLKPDMKKPQDLPLGERQTVLCSTCHDPHGSTYKFMARKDRKKEICVSCHNPDKLERPGLRKR